MKTNSTKKSLIVSILSITMCLAMLIGTTVAWFVDSASTSVNTIQSGTLNVDIVDANGNIINDQTLAWQKAACHENEEVLWEPGCTYDLEPVTIRNNGKLALKYKIIINGINGSEKLNAVIEWTIEVGETTVDFAACEGHLTAKDTAGDHVTLTIRGSMLESANNDYQGESIENVAIKLIATQDTVEYDSEDNQYDKDAAYPISDSAEAASSISLKGYATLLNDVTLDEVIPNTSVVSVSAVDEENPVTIYAATAAFAAYGYPSTSIMYWSYGTTFAENTLNLNNVTIENGSGGNNGSIYVQGSSNCTINISDATFYAGYSNATTQQYANFVALSDSSNITVNFTNCRFFDIDGSEITNIANHSALSRMFCGFGNNNGLVIDGVTVY